MIKLFLQRCPICKEQHYAQFNAEVNKECNEVTYRGRCPWAIGEIVLSYAVTEGVGKAVQGLVSKRPGRPKKVVEG